ncbi:HPP family protein [Acidimangrovimonas sediminis]|uniref:HPP family protein n=1 Tax=Acidimangrovimonas sediminis TaxID=2056283 RepID=UPI000C7F8D58|nr:HPP family protein [Acidimangrovimonas sediminis]
MLDQWLHRHRHPHGLPDRPGLRKIAAAAIGSFVGLSLLGALAHHAGVDLLMASFGATCLLLFATPDTPLAQPRNVVGGHLLASGVGLAAMHLFAPQAAVLMALVVAVAIVLMQVTRTLHAPAGADPLVIMLKGHVLPWTFLITPVLAGAVALVLIAYAVNNARGAEKWPRYWI